MPKVLIYSDPHRGLRRAANFTPDSNARREAETGKALLDLLTTAKQEGDFVICAGDFFDTESNSEATILEALPIAEQTDLILAGNHDVPNREGRASSLDLIREVFPKKIVSNETGTELGLGSTRFFFVPHKLTQEAFEGALDRAEQRAAAVPLYRVLVLHCNFDLPEAFLTGTELNLSRARAEQLLGTFHSIAIGHEHTAADHYDGRLKIVGSVFPTAFDNMGQKRVLVYDTETGKFEDYQTWCQMEYFWPGSASKLNGTTFTGREQYFDVLDDLEPGQAQKLVVALFKGGAFGVRLRRPETAQPTRTKVEARQFERLPETIEADLAKSHPELLELWKEMRAET